MQTVKIEKKEKMLSTNNYKAVLFILSSDPRHFGGSLLQELRMDTLKGKDSYPANVTLDHELLKQYEKQHVTHRRNATSNSTAGQGTQFLQAPPNTTFVTSIDLYSVGTFVVVHAAT